MRIAIILNQRIKRMPHQKICLLLIIIFLGVSLSSCFPQSDQFTMNSGQQDFDAERAFSDLEYQVNLGPRVMGSDAHSQVRDWLLETGRDQNWTASEQVENYQAKQIFNVIVKREPENDYPLVILGAHYDSRVIADRDPQLSKRGTPVPGANDGASGISVLRELARVIPQQLKADVWIVFFDAEDNGSMPGGEWIVGSRLFVESLQAIPDAVVIVDMVGDQDLDIYIEKNSDATLVEEIWTTADHLGYAQDFISLPKHRIIDDHLPFIQAGIPAVDIIDFDYPYWHTTADTIDKVSSESLGIVGDVVLTWLIQRYGLDS